MSHIKKHIIINGVECKVCNKCGRTLPLSEFSRHARTHDGYQVTCKTCFRALNEQSRAIRQEIKAERKAIEAEKAKAKSKPNPASRLAKAADEERCATCKSFSNCGHGNGYCLRIKVGCRSNNVCGDYQPNIEMEYKQVAKPVRVFNLTPYD